MTGIAFGTEARRIAVSMAPDSHFDPSRQAIHVWDLEYHRGIQSLRGLDSQIAHSKTCFTRDGSRIAAISLAWQAAIWDLPSGSLRVLFDMAPGLTADNAGLAFSHDGRKFAVSGGSEARMWDLESGQVTAWQLPEGLVDTLVFDATGKKLFLFRTETSDSTHVLDSSSRRRLSPRVCRVRDLLANPQRDLRRPGKDNPAWETGFFDAGVFIVKATPDGRFFVAVGDHGFDQKEHLLKVFECATGKEVLSIGASAFHLDATGDLLQFTRNDSPGQYPLIEIPSGKWIGTLNPPASALGPGAHFLANEHSERFGHTLYRRGDETPLVSLGIDTLSAEGRATFSRDGTRLAWGNQDGTVTVCYLADVQRRLASIGFGW